MPGQSRATAMQCGSHGGRSTQSRAATGIPWRSTGHIVAPGATASVTPSAPRAIPTPRTVATGRGRAAARRAVARPAASVAAAASHPARRPARVAAARRARAPSGRRRTRPRPGPPRAAAHQRGGRRHRRRAVRLVQPVLGRGQQQVGAAGQRARPAARRGRRGARRRRAAPSPAAGPRAVAVDSRVCRHEHRSARSVGARLEPDGAGRRRRRARRCVSPPSRQAATLSGWPSISPASSSTRVVVEPVARRRRPGRAREQTPATIAAADEPEPAAVRDAVRAVQPQRRGGAAERVERRAQRPHDQVPLVARHAPAPSPSTVDLDGAVGRIAAAPRPRRAGRAPGRGVEAGPEVGAGRRARGPAHRRRRSDAGSRRPQRRARRGGRVDRHA